MATTDIQSIDRLPVERIESTIGSVKRMLKVAAAFAVVGYLLVAFSLTQEFATVTPLFAEDSMKMWLKLGGVAHVLIGIFVALVAIVRVLSLMPHRLSYEMERTAVHGGERETDG